MEYRTSKGGIVIVESRKPYEPEPEKGDVLCPKCSSNGVVANVIVHGFATVSVNDGEVDDAGHLEFDIDDVDECECIRCNYEWSERERKNKK